MNRLIKVTKKEDILPQYRNTPIELLFEYHNLGRQLETYNNAQLLVGMCMDNRKHLHIPENFAFVIRSGGANLRHSEFKVSYAIAIGKVKYIAVIGHNHCAMVNLVSRKDEFVKGLMDNAGWEEDRAIEHFNQFAPTFEIGSEIDFVLGETQRLRKRYPKVTIAPLLFLVEDTKLNFIKED